MIVIICLYTWKSLQVLLFNPKYFIQHNSFICTQSNSCKYCYVILIFQFRHIFKEFQVLLRINDNSIKQTLVYIQLNGQRVLFLTTRLNGSHLFAHNLNVKQFNLTFDRTLSDFTTQGERGPRRNGNEGVLYILQISKNGN